jgi:hypothetical protein
MGEEGLMIANIQPESAYRPSIEPYDGPTVADVAYQQPIERTKWGLVLDALRNLRNLPDDWDGEGSDAPPRPIVEWAIRLVPFLRERNFGAPDTAVASRSGTVIFGWRNGREYVEIEVVGANEMELMMVDGHGETIHREFSLPVEPISSTNRESFQSPLSLSA